MASDAGAWRRLEPASLLVNLLPDLWRTTRAAWPLLLAVFVGGGLANLVNLLLLAFFFAMGVSRTVLHFLTLRYRLHEGKLEIRSGLVARRFRVIDPSRIQNVEIVQNVFHKVAGLVELRVETAGEAGAEGLLSALSVEAATELREALHQVSAPPTTANHRDELLAITLPELVGYGVSAGRVGAVVIAAGVAIEVLGQASPERMAQGLQGLPPGAAMGAMLLALAGGYALSVGGTILRHYGFRLVRSTRGLRFEGGLLTRRGVEMALSKVQLVRVDEPWMRRLMGYGTLFVETAASGAPGEQQAPEGMVPMVPLEDTSAVARVVLPGLDVEAWDEPLLPAAPRALIRACAGGALRWGFLGLLLSRWIGFASFGFVAWGILLGVLDWRRQGWRVTPGYVVARAGFLNRRTWIVPRAKIQSVHLRSDPLMRQFDLAQVVVWVAGSAIGLPALETGSARRVFEELRERPKEAPVMAEGTGPVEAADTDEATDTDEAADTDEVVVVRAEPVGDPTGG